jgi:hypothetical protein
MLSQKYMEIGLFESIGYNFGSREAVDSSRFSPKYLLKPLPPGINSSVSNDGHCFPPN